MKKLSAVLPLVLAVVVLLAGACTSRSAPTTTPPSTTTPTTPTSAPSDQTFGQYADLGKAVFTDRCAKCHGANGEGVTGPKLIGTGTNLPAYKTAQGLLSFISSAMPLDAPGSLIQTQYLQVLSFILVQDNYVSASASFDVAQLSNIQITR